MPKVTAATLAVTALIVLGLTGCAGTRESAGDERAAPQVSESAPPLVAETPDASGEGDVDAAFLEKFHEIRATMPGESVIPNAADEQLLTAGKEACERLRAGEPSDTIVLIDGETKNGADYYSDSGAIITAARQTLCTDMIG